MYQNDANAPAGINPPVKMYDENVGYTYIAEKHSEKILTSTDLAQDINPIPLFDTTKTAEGILASNIEDPKKLPAGTSFLGMQVSTRIFLRNKAGEAGVPSAELLARASELAYRAVINFAPDQRTSFGQFKLAKHFPVVSGLASVDAGGVVAIAPSNDSQSSNVVEIPLPWQSRATLDTVLYLPKWEDTTTELVVSTILSGRVTEGPART